MRETAPSQTADWRHLNGGESLDDCGDGEHLLFSQITLFSFITREPRSVWLINVEFIRFLIWKDIN